VSEYPLSITHFSHGSHAWTESIVCERNIVDYWSPVDQIRGRLMGELLSMKRISLVRVVNHDLAVVGVDKWFPDGMGAVCGIWAGTSGDVGDIVPCFPARMSAIAGKVNRLSRFSPDVRTGIDVNIGRREVSRDGVSSCQDSASWKLSDLNRKLVEEGL